MRPGDWPNVLVTTPKSNHDDEQHNKRFCLQLSTDKMNYYDVIHHQYLIILSGMSLNSMKNQHKFAGLRN